jgi:hypothetical protein
MAMQLVPTPPAPEVKPINFVSLLCKKKRFLPVTSEKAI